MKKDDRVNFSGLRHLIAHLATTFYTTSPELDPDDEIIVYCHHGVRSANVVSWLRDQGVAACQSMSGGIDRWSAEVDPGVPRY